MKPAFAQPRVTASRAAAVTLLALVMLLATVASEAAAHHYDSLLAPSSACGGPRQTDTTQNTAELQMVMRCLHNQARTRAARQALGASPQLGSSSSAKSADIVRCRQFSHNACGRSTLYHVERSGYTSGGCWGASENIAWGSGRLGSPRSIMSGWLHSDRHRTTILNTRYRELGVGVRKATFQSYSNAHVWTGHFGYRC